MDVKELLDVLTAFDGDTEVIVEVDGTSYRPLHRINRPCGDEDRAMKAICLVSSSEEL